MAPVTLDVSLSLLVDAACGDGTTVLLLDTPGLDAPNRNAAWDAQIMVRGKGVAVHNVATPFSSLQP